MIPEAAVEAAFAALFPKEPTPSSFKSAVWDPTIKTILEAAAPHMLREAWDDGHSAGVDHADGIDGGSNPYDRPTP